MNKLYFARVVEKTGGSFYIQPSLREREADRDSERDRDKERETERERQREKKEEEKRIGGGGT